MNLSVYDGNINTVDFLDLMMFDIYGGIRHVTIPKGHISDKVIKEGVGFDASNLGFAKVSKSDMVAIPDMSSALLEDSTDKRILHVFCDIWTMDGEIFTQYPRYITRKTLEYIQSTRLADDLQMLVELEFHIFDNVNYATDFSHSYYKLQSAEGIGPDFTDLPRFSINKGYHRSAPEDTFFEMRNEMVSLMENAGIPVKYHHHEVGAAQLEIELDFMSLADVADKVAIAKWIIKNICDKYEVFVTFMPKPIYKAAGNGMHVHQFLAKNGASTFAGDQLFGLSNQALYYTSGLLEHSLSGSLLAFTNPSTNSYKRLVPGYEAPICATLAKASREASVRVPGYLKKGEERIEYRTGDATANIHYMLSAMALAGMDGIAREIDPVKAGYDHHDPAKTFPLNLNAVLEGLDRDCDYLLKVFPRELIDLWIKLKRGEAEHVYNSPTPQEYELYFNL